MDNRLVLSVEMFNCGNETFSDTKPNTSEDVYCNKQTVKTFNIVNVCTQKHTHVHTS